VKRRAGALGPADLILRASYIYRYAIRVMMPFDVGEWRRVGGPIFFHYSFATDWMRIANLGKRSMETIVIKVFD